MLKKVTVKKVTELWSSTIKRSIQGKWSKLYQKNYDERDFKRLQNTTGFARRNKTWKKPV